MHTISGDAHTNRHMQKRKAILGPASHVKIYYAYRPDCSFFPFNKLHGTVYHSQLLGTHEVQTVDANNGSRPGVVNVSCTFAENSRAMGYLSILFNYDSSQEMFVVADKRDATSADLNISAGLNISVPGVPPGDYMVAVFDLESSGLPVLSSVANQYTRSAGEGDDITVLKQGKDEGIV